MGIPKPQGILLLALRLHSATLRWYRRGDSNPTRRFELRRYAKFPSRLHVLNSPLCLVVRYSVRMAYGDLEKKRAYQREYTARRRQAWFDEHGPCEICGSSDDLEADHRDPATKVLPTTVLWNMAPDNPKRVAELAKCRALCAPCHWEKTRTEYRKGEAMVNAKLTEVRGPRDPRPVPEGRPYAIRTGGGIRDVSVYDPGHRPAP